MLFLYRNLESLLQPVGFTWAMLTIAAVCYARRKRKRSAAFAGALSLYLFVTGSTPLPEYLLATLERPYAQHAVINAPAADVVIVLGGFINPSRRDAFGFSLNNASDRIVAAIELARAGKSSNLVFGGGASIVDGKPSSEGARVTEWLREWNIIPSAKIYGLPACRNTRAEAIALRSLMEERKWDSVILVTSGFHMGRAMATFRRVGIRPHPIPCDFEGLPAFEDGSANWRIVPTLDHIGSFNLFVHEVIGLGYYKLRGWI